MKLPHLFIILALCTVTGCAFIGKQVDYASLCAKDPVCLQDSKDKANLVRTVTEVVYPPAAGVIGGVALTLLLWWNGRKKENAK